MSSNNLNKCEMGFHVEPNFQTKWKIQFAFSE